MRRWMSIIKNAMVAADRDHMWVFAAGLSYYFVLSFFPALIALSAIVSLLPLPNLFNPTIALMSRVIPPDTIGIVHQILHDLMNPHRGALLSFGIVSTLWTASSGFSAMIEALNVAYAVPETRPFWKTRGLAVLMVLLLGGLLLIALAAMVVGPEFGGWLARVLHISLLARIWPWVRWTVSGAFIVAAVESIYLLGPNLKQRVVHTLVGAVFAVILWLALSYALGIYFQRFANFNRTYGALGGVIALMIWMYWSSFVILLGAAINGQALQASGQGRLPLKQPVPRLKQETAKPGDLAA